MAAALHCEHDARNAAYCQSYRFVLAGGLARRTYRHHNGPSVCFAIVSQQ